ncbi:3-oxoacyl-[acyl-carrier-protein] reductase [Alicyclobacillus sp. SO9]|uniref:3-oxoacyl-[acyl-carrier-protein] reductase n=1 Tax=Alicyclobacillus sp. SO9 TaxID=2665646 RepID=UPI0018E8CEAE|nr:3-oxoacyl-[acyl-carrier-protein] reductase [Alicyclobacillus sp. SO9]QQE78404.1 3-oxoacyl-[acyl-carrier-protein] reductase [Alicyclobacillus sp. SO9]
MLLDEKVAIVTGASRGIGRDIAKAFAQQGAMVALNYTKNQEAAEDTRDEIIKGGDKAFLVQADVSLEQDVQSMMQRIIEKYGRVDVLVNNAGITMDNILMNMSVEQWDGVMATNLRGPFLCTKHVIRKMMRQRAGKIINVSSISGVLGNAGQANYAASKAGLIGLTKAIAQEYGAKGITANVIAPGLVDTNMSRRVPESVMNQKLEEVLLKRPGSTSEIASVAVFLASTLSDYINGELIRVDGGIRF